MAKSSTKHSPQELAVLDRLSALLLERAGLRIAREGYYSLRLAIASRMPAVGMTEPAEYVHWLHQPQGEHELRSLVPLVTVGHTEFFRDSRQFRGLEVRILPEIIALGRKEGRRAQIWSAGCATGEEPYSLAISSVERGATLEDVAIYATDLNQAAVQSAVLGRYPARRVASLERRRLERFFVRVGDQYEVAGDLRDYIRFESQNLAAPAFSNVEPGSFDLILCRNVIIYFDMPTIRSLMDRFLAALRPGGYLLLGYSESLFKVYDRFEMVEVEGSFVYRRPASGASPKPLSPPLGTRGEGSSVTRGGAATPRAATPLSEMRRVTPSAVPATAPSTPASKPLTPPPAPPRPMVVRRRSPQERIDAAVDRMNRGDFNGARGALEQLCQDEPNDLDSLLTLGNLYSLLGEDAASRQKFEEALANEPLCVDARVFAGVAALQAGRLEDARSELSKALFLEPTLALGHYLLAQVFERTAHREDARRAYRNAIAQIKFTQRPLAGHYPDIPETPDAIQQAARYALAALEEVT